MRLLINSLDRISSSTSTTDFIIVLNEAIKNISKVKLIAADITNSFYNINSTNNTFSWEEDAGGDLISSTLTNGSYSPDTYIVMLKTILDGDTLNAQVYTITYDIDTAHI